MSRGHFYHPSYGTTTILGERDYRGLTLQRVSGSQIGYRTPWVRVLDEDGEVVGSGDTYEDAQRSADAWLAFQDDPEAQAHAQRIIRKLTGGE